MTIKRFTGTTSRPAAPAAAPSVRAQPRAALALGAHGRRRAQRGHRSGVRTRRARAGVPAARIRQPRRGIGIGAFSVRLEEFEGPFDLLLSLIAKHRLDVTVLALHRVIDDFLAHIRACGPEWDLGRGDRVPRRRCHAARPQGGAPAALGRGRGRGGSRAAGGARPALRAAAAVPGLQGGRRRPGPAAGGRRPTPSARRVGLDRSSPACCPRCCSAWARRSSRRWRPARWPPDRRPQPCRRLTSTRPGQRPGAGGDPDGRLRRHQTAPSAGSPLTRDSTAGRRGPLPGPARALPGAAQWPSTRSPRWANCGCAGSARSTARWTWTRRPTTTPSIRATTRARTTEDDPDDDVAAADDKPVEPQEAPL